MSSPELLSGKISARHNHKSVLPRIFKLRRTWLVEAENA
jgi:hypothetical protein